MADNSGCFECRSSEISHEEGKSSVHHQEVYANTYKGMVTVAKKQLVQNTRVVVEY